MNEWPIEVPNSLKPKWYYLRLRYKGLDNAYMIDIVSYTLCHTICGHIPNLTPAVDSPYIDFIYWPRNKTTFCH